MRAEEKRPPGYKDAGKDDAEAAAGDYLIWRPVLLRARAHSRDVLIITGDVKEDWWRKERGETRGPRPELVEEMKNFANVRLFMLRPASLLVLARRILQIHVSDESVQDIERVDRALEEMADAPVDTDDLLRTFWDEILDQVKGRRRVAWMLLTSATIKEVNGNLLVLQFKREGEAKGFVSAGYAKDLRDVLIEFFDIDFLIEATYGNATEVEGPGSRVARV